VNTPDRLAHRAAQEAAFAAMVPPAPDRPAAGPQPIAFPGDADPAAVMMWPRILPGRRRARRPTAWF